MVLGLEFTLDNVVKMAQHILPGLRYVPFGRLPFETLPLAMS